MNKRLDNRGFSLVELIVVMGIMGIMIGSSASVLNYVQLGNVKKCANKINEAIGEVRSDTMTQAETPYLVVYKCSSGIYAWKANVSTVSAVTASSLDGSLGQKIANSNLTIKTHVEGAASEVELPDAGTPGTVSYIVIRFKKSTGAFSNDPAIPFYDWIEVSNNTRAYRVNMIKETGRYYVE